MAINTLKLQNILAFQKRIAHLLYPVIFSLLSVLDVNAEDLKSMRINSDKHTSIVPQVPTSNTSIDAQKKGLIPMDAIVMDSTFAKGIETMFNKLTQADLSSLERQKLNKNIINGILFYFNDAEDPSKAIAPENIYLTRKSAQAGEKLDRFLNYFYKESYWSAGTLHMSILSIYQKDKKIYIDYDYVYTPKDQLKPKQ